MRVCGNSADEVSAESHNNVVYAKMRCLASDLAPALGIYAQILREPAIPEEGGAPVIDPQSPT